MKTGESHMHQDHFQTYLNFPKWYCNTRNPKTIPSVRGPFKAKEGFFASLALEETMRDALAEAALALTVFGLASAMLQSYRKHNRKKAAASTAKQTSKIS